MAFDDLPLDRPAPPGSPTPGARPPSPTRWIVIGAGAVIAGALLALWWMSRAQPVATVPAPTAATDVALKSKRPVGQPGIDLPPLDESDTSIRDLISALSRHPTLARLLATKGLVRSATLAVVQIGEGKTPATPLAALRPASRLRIVGGSTGKVDPITYIRWDSAVASLISVNPNEASQAYVNVKRLFDQAYRDLGHTDGDFDDAIVRAIRTLDDTPNIAGDPVLLQRPNYFEHEDPALSSLLPVQKQLLLLGPAHRKRVMTWLHQFAAALELKID